MKTNYAGHDKVYQKHREQGHPGWNASEAGYTQFKAHVDRIIARGSDPQSGRLLELGCGAGNMTIWFAEMGYEAHGVDISPLAIEWAKERTENENANVRFVVGDVVGLSEYPDSNFDFVFDGHCLHCIIGEDRPKLLANVWRVLKPGGYVMINTMCAPVIPEKLKGYDPDSRCTIIGGITGRYYGDADDILAEIAAAGLEVLRYDVTSDGTDHANHDLIVEAQKPA